jgi:glycosyltransferase involved in cell wall biosynthesis
VRITLLKSGSYASWASERPGTLPYRFDLLARRATELSYTDAHLEGRWSRPPIASLVATAERAFVPFVQTLLLLRRMRRSDAVLAMFESEGHFLAALRWLRFPASRRPVFGVVTCWLTPLLASAGPRKLRWYRRLYSSVDRVFVLSSSQVAPTAVALGLPEDRVRFVHFGVDAETFAPEDAVEGDYVLVAGRDRSRDWPTAFEAARGSDLRFKVLARPSDLRGLEPPANVEVLGYRPFEEYRRLLLGARVVVVAVTPRAYPTGQTVLLEAMAAGKAAVVTSTPALADYLTGSNAVEVAPGRPDELRAAIERVAADADLRRSLGAEGRRFVEERANADRMWRTVADELEAARR